MLLPIFLCNLILMVLLSVNVVLMGVLSKMMDIPEEEWDAALLETVPPKFLEMNKKAFALGREAAK